MPTDLTANPHTLPSLRLVPTGPATPLHHTDLLTLTNSSSSNSSQAAAAV